MSRASARELAVHLIYGIDFTGESPAEIISSRLNEEYYACLRDVDKIYAVCPSPEDRQYLNKVVFGVSENRNILNGTIQMYAIGWDVSRISRLSRAIMQLAIYEMEQVEDVPVGVAISQAVALAKRYDGDEAGAFVNGILGAYARTLPAEVK